MKRSFHRLVCLAALAATAGCVSVDRDAEQAVAALRSGDDATAAAWAADLATNSSYSAALGTVEAGRVSLLAGDFPAAEAWFRQAVDSAIDRNEAQPKIKIGDVGNTVLASTITDDRTRNYELAPYELNLALQYGIVAQAMNGRLDAALVDARLAVYVQDTLATTYGADIEANGSSTNAAAQDIYVQQSENLQAMMAGTRNSWENPLLWWLTGVMFEANGERDFAEPSYRKALAIAPDNPVFAADVARIARTATPTGGCAKLVVVFDEGLVQLRESMKIPVPIYTGMAIDIPMYRGAAYVPSTVAVAGSSDLVAAAPAMNVQALAARDLKERLVGIITRNVTRCAVQAAAQAAVNAAGNEYAKIAVFAANAVISAIRHADTRSWVTLPGGAQVWSDASMAPGVYDVRIEYAGTTESFRTPLAAGETRLLYVAAPGSGMRGMSCTLGGKGATPAYEKHVIVTKEAK
jgi:uncharacterized protein